MALTAVFAYRLSGCFLAAFGRPASTVVDDLSTAELLLDEPLAAGPEARVVQLFAPALPRSMASSGQPARSASATPADASQDLRDALMQLRRSLRQA